MGNLGVNNSSSVGKTPVVAKGAAPAQGAAGKAEAGASLGKDSQSVTSHEVRYADITQPDSCFPPSPPLVEFIELKVGASGGDVKMLQELLKRLDPGLEADGLYGAKTEAAVRKYQEANGLKVDGFAGQETQSALMFQYQLAEAQDLLKNPPERGDAEALAAWQDCYKTATEEAHGYLEGLRPESAEAKERMLGELSTVLTTGNILLADLLVDVKPPTVTPTPKPPSPQPVAPKPVTPAPKWTAEQIQSKVDAIGKDSMDLDELTKLTMDGTLDKMPREVKFAALERMTGNFNGWDSLAANNEWREAGAKLGVALMRERPDAATVQAILDTMDEKYRDGFIQAAANSGIPLKPDVIQLLRSKIDGTSGDGIDADDLRNQLAKLQLLS